MIHLNHKHNIHNQETTIFRKKNIEFELKEETN